NHFESIEDALAAAHDADERLTPALRKKLIEGSDYVAIAPKLVHCALDVPIPSMSIAMPTKPLDMSQIWQYKEQYGLGSSIDRMIAALNW
ncbi:MAG: flap endonuclease, partial [Actinomycetes bacterium]